MPKPVFSSFPGFQIGTLLMATLFCFDISVSGAGPVSPMSSSTTEAQTALRKAVAFQRESKDLAFNFLASVYNPTLDKKENYSGKLLLKDSTKFRLEIPGGTYVSDGVHYWEYHVQNHQVILRKASDLKDQPLPGDVLLRFLDSKPMALIKTSLHGKEYLEMRLDPSLAMKNLDSLVVMLDKENFSLYRVSSRDVSGNEAQYTVTSLKKNRGINDREFVFVSPKGSELVDMRE
jgi:outer membrane lipoprotein-sorting protein